MSEWQPIETAPKDGTTFLAYKHGRVADCTVFVRSDGEVWQFGSHSAHAGVFPDIVPTHWMPLPPAP